MDCNTVQYYANIATIVGVVGIIGVFFQFAYQRQQHKKEWSILYIEKYSDKELAEYGRKARVFFETTQDKTQAYKEHKEDVELSRSIRIYLNYFEALGYLYINNIVDRSMIVEMLGSVSLYMHKLAKWYIDIAQDEVQKTQTDEETILVGLPYTEWGLMNKMILGSDDNKIILPGRPAP